MEQTLPAILSNYHSHYIYNADELGLHFKGEECSGGKNSNIWLTGLAAANAFGKKILMFVIGKQEKFRCFKKIRRIPCCYRAQR